MIFVPVLLLMWQIWSKTKAHMLMVVAYYWLGTMVADTTVTFADIEFVI